MAYHLFQLPIGDWSNDGHNICEWHTIRSNKDIETVKAIFKKMNAEVHLNSLFEDFEQSTISDFDYERLIDKVPDAAEFFGEYEGDRELELGSDGAAELFIACMHAYDSELQLEIVKLPQLTEASFGYGLFSP